MHEKTYFLYKVYLLKILVIIFEDLDLLWFVYEFSNWAVVF